MIFSSNGEKYFEKAKICFKQGAFKKAKRYYLTASLLNYNPSLCRLYIGIIQLYELQINEAFSTFQMVLTSNDSISEAYYYLGKVFQAFDNPQESKSYFEKSILHSKSEINRLLSLEEIQDTLSQTEFEYYKKFAYNAYKIRHNIPEDEKLLRQALIARLEGNFEKAHELFNELIYLYPNNFSAYYELSKTYIQQNQIHLAYNTLKKTESYFNVKRLVLKELSHISFLLKKYKESASSLRKLIQLSPKNHKLYFNLATSLAQMGHYNESLKYYKKTIEFNPSFYPAFYNIGVIYQKNGFLEESLEYYQKALLLKPEDADLHYNLGIIYFEIQDYFQSLYYFMKAYRLDNNLKEALSNFEVIRNIRTMEKNVIKPLELSFPSKVSLMFTFIMIIVTFFYFIRWI